MSSLAFALVLADPGRVRISTSRACGTVATALDFVGLAQAGTWTIQVIPDDSSTGTATLTLTGLQVASVAPTAELNTHYSTTLKVKPGTAPYTWAVSAGTLPPGLSLSAAGVITGNPSTLGSSSFTVTVTDAAFQTASKAMTVAVVQPLLISSTSMPNGNVNTPYSATVAATGGTTPYAWSITLGTLPPGLTLDPASGQISGTPTTAGTSSFTVQAKDTSNPALTEKASLSIVVS